MQRCPACGSPRDVRPLAEAMRNDARLRPSEFGWISETRWGMLPPRRATIGMRSIAERVIGQLKPPSRGVRGVLQRAVGVVVGVAAAVFGIPLLILALYWLAATSIVLLPLFLIAWLVGVVLLVRWSIRPHTAPDPYGRAMIRLADFSYCSECDSIFETENGRVVPVDRLGEVLYADKRGAPGRNYLADC